MNNPQYRLRLHSKNISGSNQTKRIGKDEKSPLRLFVEGPRNVPLNVMLVWRREEESKERVMRYAHLRPIAPLLILARMVLGLASLS